MLMDYFLGFVLLFTSAQTDLSQHLNDIVLTLQRRQSNMSDASASSVLQVQLIHFDTTVQVVFEK